MEKLFVIKIGGQVLDDPQALTVFLEQFAGIGAKKLLVHGGGAIASRIGEKMGVKPKYADGRRITDAPTLEIVSMVYGGLVNKQLVARLQSLGCNAIGLTGADAGIIPAVKRPVGELDYGFAGDILPGTVRAETGRLLLDNGMVPVMAPLTFDASGGLLNTNADTIASAMAVALAGYYKVRLIYCFEKKGVLQDPKDPDSVIAGMNSSRFEELKSSGSLTAGILPKLESAIEAVRMGVAEVLIGRAADLNKNITDAPSGTLIS